jgi:hypothetical protein
MQVIGLLFLLVLLFVFGGLFGWIIKAISEVIGFLTSGWSHGCGGCLGCLWVIFILLLILAGLCL